MKKQKQSNEEMTYRDPYTIDWIEQLKGADDAIKQDNGRANDFAAVRATKSKKDAQTVEGKSM